MCTHDSLRGGNEGGVLIIMTLLDMRRSELHPHVVYFINILYLTTKSRNLPGKNNNAGRQSL
jgi:hypothetical protein